MAGHAKEGEHNCSQMDPVGEMFRDLPLLDVYVAPVREDIADFSVYPPERQAEIDAVSHPRVKAEKYCVWQLLAYAVRRSLGKDISSLTFKRTGTGKWTCREAFFSLSHSRGLVAVAISHKPVGVDIEARSSLENLSMYKKILTPEEIDRFEKLPDDGKQMYLVQMWTKKESRFKCSDGDRFMPTHITAEDTVTREIRFRGEIFWLSVSGESVESLRVYQLDDDSLPY